MQIFLKVLIIIVLGGGLFFTWYGVTTTNSLEGHTQVVASAARLAISPEPEFTSRLDTFRKHLAAADPDTSRYPKTWAALSGLVEKRDKLQLEKLTQTSSSENIFSVAEPLLAACEQEARVVQTQETAAMQQRLLVMSGCFWSIVTIIGLGLWAYRQHLIRQLGKYSLSPPRSLSEALSNLIESFESLQRDVQARERQALDLALMQRRIKMQTSSGSFEPVNTPLPAPPTSKTAPLKAPALKPPPSSLETIKTSPAETPAPSPVSPPLPEPYFPLAHSQSSEKFPPVPSNSSVPAFTLSTEESPTVPPARTPTQDPGADIGSAKYARLADSIGGFILGDTTDPAMVPRIPIGSGQFSQLEQLQRQNGMLVSIALQDVELFQHIYIKPEVVLEAALQNIVNLLLRCRVRPAEIAIEYDTVYWYIPAEVDISPSEIESFLLNAYRDSVFVFGDRQLELPEISITVPPRGSFFGIH
ncbi:MAG: hypothetical protein HY774_24370 [Acidobacteria bacterium]|nr:hypothetical protein [Acidobacteriota bacterium]